MTTTKQTRKPVAKKITAKSSVKKVEAAVNEATAEVTSEVAEQASSIISQFNRNLDSAKKASQQVWFAGLGAFGKSIEEVQDRYSSLNQEISNRYSQLTKDRQEIVTDLVARGEKVQNEAEHIIKEGRANIEQQIEIAKNRLTGLVSVTDISGRLKMVSDKLETLSKELKKTA